MTVEDWQKRLEETFTVRGLVGGHLVAVHDREAQVADYLVRKFRGQNVLLDSFQSFFLETLQLATDSIYRDGWPNAPNYAVALANFRGLFRRVRACETLFYRGYPLDGYSLLRDVKDSALVLAAVAHNRTTFSRMIGASDYTAGDSEWRKKATRRRKEEEHLIAKWIYGVQSELDEETRQSLKLWEDFFHEEVHGGRYSFAHEVSSLRKGKLNPPGPVSEPDAFTMYMNRSSELGWLILRLLPYLQREQHYFGADWFRKYEVLDESFRHMVFGLFKYCGKEIGQAFVRLVDVKFTFHQPFFYLEADGTAFQ